MVLRVDPPSTIHVEKLDMQFEGQILKCDGTNFIVETLTGSRMVLKKTLVSGAMVAVDIDDSGIALGAGGMGGTGTYVSISEMVLTANQGIGQLAFPKFFNLKDRR